MPKALIFGGSSQIGFYLKDFLLEQGYEVYCTYYNNPPDPAWREAVKWELVNVTRQIDISEVIRGVEPDEVYNLTSQMFAPASWNDPIWYSSVNFVAVQYMIQSILEVNPKAKFFNAGSAAVFDGGYGIQQERTPMFPITPYGVGKLAAQHLVRVYRDEKHFFGCTGILFNAESPRRKETFFTNKVCKAVARMSLGFEEKLELGTLTAKRDWGWAPEFIEPIWKMLQKQAPDDYVLGTGESHTCLEFVKEAFNYAGVLPSADRLVYSPEKGDFRDSLCANAFKAKMLLNWDPKTTFKGVIQKLVDHYILTEEQKG